ncbi:DSHCT domain protein [Ancylostoma ceylanicum]|uniref:DSHCT domain protein n=1 Tax=Ancylostoma ceylanicum TaxID=53326 RepID=A0A0D6LAY1_9BILA|nr:DSHCT domain protein [Ancylostoma ceylanicum]
MDSLTEEWSSSGPQLYDLAADIRDMDFELSDQLNRFLRLREEVIDPTLYTVRHCMRFQQHMFGNVSLEFAVQMITTLFGSEVLLNDRLIHMKNLRDRIRVERQISNLKYSLSVDALQLSDEYQNRIEELLITELILSKKLHERSPAEVAAMLSATTCQYKGGDGPKFEKDSVFEQFCAELLPSFQLKEDVQSTNRMIESVASSLRVRIADIGDELRYDLMEVVYHWAGGMPFSEIMTLTDAQEGLIVRCIQRLGEVCKDVRNAARIVGDPALHEKMEQVSAAIKRDIVFAASLYTSM